MSDQTPETPVVEAPPWALMSPGDQAIYMPCQDQSCPAQPPGHQHLDHVMHQEPSLYPEIPQVGP